MTARLSGYARSGAWSMVAYASRLVGAIALSILVVRSLTVAEFGELSLARQLTQIAVIAGGFSLERVLLRYLPELGESGHTARGRRLFWQTLGVRSAAWALLLVITYALGPWLDHLLRASVAQHALLGVTTGLVFSTHNHVHAAATAQFQTKWVAIGSTIGAVASFAAVAAFLHLGWGIDGVLLGTAMGIGLASIPMFVATLSAMNQTVAPTEGGHSVSNSRVLRYVLPFSAIAILNYAVHSQTEVFFLARYHNAEAAGFFAQGFAFAQRIIDFVPLALWEITLAGFSHIAARDPKRLAEAVRAFLILLYLVIPPIAIFGIAFSHNAIDLLYEEKMLPAVGVSQAYFFFAAIAAAGAPIGMVLYVREKVGRALIAYVLIAAINLGLDLWLIPQWGLRGAVLGLGIAKLVSVALFLALAQREIGRIRLPLALVFRAIIAASPTLLWLLVADRWSAPWQVVLGIAGAALLTIATMRSLHVVRDEEARLIRATRLPASSWILRVLGADDRKAEA